MNYRIGPPDDPNSVTFDIARGEFDRHTRESAFIAGVNFGLAAAKVIEPQAVIVDVKTENAERIRRFLDGMDRTYGSKEVEDGWVRFYVEERFAADEVKA